MPERGEDTPDPDAVAEGQRFQAAREAAGLTQSDVAAILGIDFGTLSRKERGVRRFSRAERLVLDRLYAEKLGQRPSLAPISGGLSDYSRGQLDVARRIAGQVHGLSATLAEVLDEIAAREGGIVPAAQPSPYPPAQGVPPEYYTSTDEPSPYAKQQAEEAAKRARKRRA